MDRVPRHATVATSFVDKRNVQEDPQPAVWEDVPRHATLASPFIADYSATSGPQPYHSTNLVSSPQHLYTSNGVPRHATLAAPFLKAETENPPREMRNVPRLATVASPFLAGEASAVRNQNNAHAVAPPNAIYENMDADQLLQAVSAEFKVEK